MLWIVLIAVAAAAVYWIRRAHRNWSSRSRGEEERLASFMADALRSAKPTADPAPAAIPAPLADDAAAQQQLLFDAATKAGEAGEAALSIQLYARLLARYPGSSYADRARANVEAHKKRLTKA